MCQVEEEYHDQLQRPELTCVSKRCVKCREVTASVVIKAGDAYCQGCFKEYFIHKFRAVLGKNRLIFPGEKVLLAVSGGPSSSSMLRQVQEGLSVNAHKKLRFVPGIIYIDEGSVLGLSAADRQKTKAELESVFKATGLHYHIVPLEQVLDVPSSVLVTGPSTSTQPAGAYKSAVGHLIQSGAGSIQSSEMESDFSAMHIRNTDTDSLQRLFASVTTLTAKEDLLQTLRQHLLVHTARTEGYTKLMMGDSCTRLAVKLLTSISVGRGAQLAEDTGFSDPRYGDILTVRPMRDYSTKEIAFYNHFFKVPFVFTPSLDTMVSDKASIQCLTESFITKLQVDFPSTVSTIYRTSEKLQTACHRSSTVSCCLLCMSALNSSPGNSASAFQATQISEQLSQKRPPAPSRSGCQPDELSGCSSGEAEHCCKPENGEGCCYNKGAQMTDLKSLLCYSCRLTIKDLASLELLPPYILAEAQRRQRRSEMREEISEFLLDEDDEKDL